jgi:hypothetical protein
MIAKAVKGRGFRGALEYDMEPEKGRVIDSNMSGETPRELASEFGAIRKLRPGLSRAVLHVSLSAAPGEHLTDEQWAEIGQRYLSGMGLDDNQYVMTRHTDTDHEHIHILANRITFAGATVSDSNDYKRQEALMREIEKEFNLKAVESSKESIRRAATRDETEKTKRTGAPSTRSQLQQLADAAAKDCHSFTEYAKRLDARAVSIVPVFQGDGARLSGLSYKLNGEVMKGSDLGKGYAPVGLAKRGVTYEKARDYEAVRALIDPDRKTAPAKVPDESNERRLAHRAAVAAILAGETKTPAPVAPDLERPKTPAPVVPALERPKAPERPQAPIAPASRSQALVGREFEDLASKREFGQLGYRDNNDGWRFDTPAPLRAKVDDYNKLPKEQRPKALERITADPETDRLLQQRAREIKQSRGR